VFALRVLASLALFAPLGCETAPPLPDLVLVTIDTLRADHLGAYGYERATSPNLDKLASKGVLFTRASAPSSWTKPSIASLFTSREPGEHGAVAFERHLAPGLTTLAEQLSAAGYRTLGVSGNFVHVNEATGLARGFDTWLTVSRRAAPDSSGETWKAGGQDVMLRPPDADELNAEVWKALPDTRETPLFLYVHYMDPHADYAPPDRFRAAFVRDDDAPARASSQRIVDLAAGRAVASPAERRWLVDLYDAEIAAVDAAVGELVSGLAARGYGDDTIFAFVSDHGEALGERGWFHALDLHAESLSVPLILVAGRSASQGIRRDDAVDLLDVPTTLLARAGIDPAPGMRGRDLLADGALPPRDLAAELHADPVFEEHVRPREQRLALLRWPWKLVATRDGSVVGYQLEGDARELRPVQPGDPAFPTDLAAALSVRRSQVETTGPSGVLGDDARAGLRALGYAE